MLMASLSPKMVKLLNCCPVVRKFSIVQGMNSDSF
ncbi:hypothetical protein SLEP1_g36841 [Rubroshorea leprosula]|uniref:Uncharacterized protein n=1 Tax=Rubroshorea leprosula TaxID=152421 RepID=A0AAV5KT26_9ROSI|nr:hypothetical protein SLEP1_g36841 [Rubroshorea leprosula]